MSALPDMSTGSVTVIGDVMLDRFWSGASRRVSPEAPVPVVSVMGQEDRAGGAGNVAVNLAELGLSVSLVGLCGEDEHARALRACVEASGVRWNVMPCPSETIVKLRVLSRNQQLLRMDFEESLAKHANDLFVRTPSNTSLMLIWSYSVTMRRDLWSWFNRYCNIAMS